MDLAARFVASTTIPEGRRAGMYAAVHMGKQAPAFVLPPPQAVQLPFPESAIPDVMAILAAMSPAWTADKLVPRAKMTPRSKAKICRDDHRFMCR